MVRYIRSGAGAEALAVREPPDKVRPEPTFKGMILPCALAYGICWLREVTARLEVVAKEVVRSVVVA